MYTFLCRYMFSIVLGIRLGVELLGHIITMFNLLRNHQNVFQTQMFSFDRHSISLTCPQEPPTLDQYKNLSLHPMEGELYSHRSGDFILNWTSNTACSSFLSLQAQLSPRCPQATLSPPHLLHREKRPQGRRGGRENKTLSPLTTPDSAPTLKLPLCF